jgi:hypothetical protein
VPSPDEKTKRPINIVPGSPGQPLPSPAELRNLKPVPSSTQPEEEVPEAMRPPRVLVHLTDTVIEELMPIVHTTKIDAGVPMATVEIFCFFLVYRYKSISLFLVHVDEKWSTTGGRYSIQNGI